MEADVAIHSHENWAAGESCYDQGEKVKYKMYSGRRKEKEPRIGDRKTGKIQIKSSRSYDNELETSVGRDCDLISKANITNVKDDLSLAYGKKPGIQPSKGKVIMTQPQTCLIPSPAVPDYRDKVRANTEQGYSDSGKKKWKPKEKSPAKKYRSRHRRHAENQGTAVSSQETGEQPEVAEISEKTFPVEFDDKKEQLTMLKSGPKLQHKRPTTLSSSLASPSSREKPAPHVILEVKDGPTLFYKPSDFMVSDSGIGDERPSVSYSSSKGNSTVTVPGIAYSPPVGALAARKSSFDAGLQDLSRDSKGPTSHLPRGLGLRKPDLSVLKNSPQSKTRSSQDEINVGPKEAVKPDIHQNVTLSLAAQVTPALLPLSPTMTLPSSPTVATTPPCQPSVLKATTSKTVPTENQGQDASKSESLSENILHGPMPAPSYDNGSESSTGFLNTNEILQQKAGIKHDDIVVGPRRPRSLIPNEDTSVSPSRDRSSITYEDFIGVQQVPQLSFPPSQSPDLSTQAAPKFQPKKANEGPGGSGGKQETNLNGQRTDSSVTLKQKLEGPKSDVISIASNESEENKSESGRWRPKEKKSGIHRPKRSKRDENVSAESGYATDIAKPEISDASPVMPLKTGVGHKLHSETSENDGRFGAEFKFKSKSENSSPAKQPQQTQPKFKSATSTPTKRPGPTSRLHMLSNIPVPICHDPPSKRNSYHSTAPSNTTETVPSSALRKPQTETTQLPSSATESKTDSTHQLISSSAFPSNSEASSASPQTKDAKTVESLCPSQIALDQQSNQNKTVASSVLLLTKFSPVKAGSQQPASQTQQVENNSSTVQKDNENPPGQNTEDATTHIPVKPRLHRSVEHLFGNTQLTIFNSTDNVQHLDKNSPSDKSQRTFQDVAKSEKVGVDSISPLKKAHGLPKIGILRRGSDRTEMGRRGSERAIPISRNDPSVEDLKKATSLKELCQSVASLLNIDNEKAAEMITTSLSQRQDLVEGLDADAILDYLSHHGVLDPVVLGGLGKGATPTQRNSTIIKHVEEHGSTAVALFINALRQSGQLHLASSLDTEQRIKPVSGDGYFGKDRHKGEVTIRIEIEALKIIAPREPRLDKIVDTSLLSSPGHQSDVTDGGMVKDDEDDFVQPRSCWCFCFSRKSKAKGNSSSLPKKENEKRKKSSTPKQKEATDLSLKQQTRPEGHEKVESKDASVKPHRTKSKDKQKKNKEHGTKSSADKNKDEGGKTKEKNKEKKYKKSKSKSSGKSSVAETTNENQVLDSVPSVAFSGGRDEVVMGSDGSHQNGSNGQRREQSGSSLDYSHQPYPSHQRSLDGLDARSPSTLTRKPDKESWDPIIMEYDPKLELVKLRAGQEELASPTRQAGNIGIMCEQWKSNGRHFLQKASQLCDRIIQQLQTEIIKYFEQDRGTLVLDVISDGSAIVILNICMMRAQVKRLQQEVEDDSLLNKLEDMFFSTVDISTFDIRGVKLRIVLDEQQVNIALSELS